MPLPLLDRAELGQLLRLMGPILVTQLAQTAFGFVDTLMAGQVSPLDLAAVALGAGIWLPIYLLLSGILMATTPLVAKHFGADDHHHIPPTVQQALWLALGFGLLGALLLRQASPVLELLGTPTAMRALTLRYLDGLSLGIPAVTVFVVLRCYVEALGRPVPVMLISILGLLLNIPANYAFIYGKLGLPAMGGAGCGWATAVVMWAMLILLAGYVLLTPALRHYPLLQNWTRPHLERMLNFLRLGVPMGVAIFFEVSVFAIVALLIAPLGERVVAGHQIALNVTSLLFMFPLSLAIAMTIRVGQAFGAREADAIRRIQRTGFATAVLMSLLSASLIVLARDSITALYTRDVSVRLLAADLLLFAAGYQVVDALQVAAAGCLRGLHDTKGPMQLTLIAYWGIALPVGYLLGLTTWLGAPRGPYGFWTGLVLGLVAACLLLTWRLRWQMRRVLPTLER